MPNLLFLKKWQNLKLSSAAIYRWRFKDKNACDHSTLLIESLGMYRIFIKPAQIFHIMYISLAFTSLMRLAFCSVPFSLLNGQIKQTITLQSKFSIPVESQCSLLTRFVKKP